MGRRVRMLPTRRRAERIHRSVRHHTTQAKVAHMVRAPTSTMGRQAPQAGSDPSHLTTTTANQIHTQATNATRSTKATVLIRLPKTSRARFQPAHGRLGLAEGRELHQADRREEENADKAYEGGQAVGPYAVRHAQIIQRSRRTSHL